MPRATIRGSLQRDRHTQACYLGGRRRHRYHFPAGAPRSRCGLPVQGEAQDAPHHRRRSQAPERAPLCHERAATGRGLGDSRGHCRPQRPTDHACRPVVQLRILQRHQVLAACNPQRGGRGLAVSRGHL